MFDIFDTRNRDKLLLELNKKVAAGDNNLAVGEYFTHSHNMAQGDRSFMQCIWQVKALTAQQVYAVCVLNTEGLEKEDSSYKRVGRTFMFDRAEYQFYDAKELYESIIKERTTALEAAKEEAA